MKKIVRNKKLWRFTCYTVILIGVLSAKNLYCKIEEELSREEMYHTVYETAVFQEISSICRAKSVLSNFDFSTDKLYNDFSYKLYTGDYGSEFVYTNSRSLYELYLQSSFVFQYLSFDMALIDPDNAHLYAEGAQSIARLKELIVTNPSEDDFRAHSDDFVETIEKIEPLKEIWEEENDERGSGDSIAFMRNVFEQFVELN